MTSIQQARASTHLEDDRLVVLLEIVREHVRVHERLAAQAEDVDGFLEELHLDPRHVVLLHVLHALSDASVQLQETTQLPLTSRGTKTTGLLCNGVSLEAYELCFRI